MKKIETDARLFEHPPAHVDQPFNAREKMNKFAELKTGRSFGYASMRAKNRYKSVPYERKPNRMKRLHYTLKSSNSCPCIHS
jgi:hypothetical protein